MLREQATNSQLVRIPDLPTACCVCRPQGSTNREVPISTYGASTSQPSTLPWHPDSMEAKRKEDSAVLVSRLPARRVLGYQDGVGISRLITGLTWRLRLAPAAAPLRLLRPAK